MGFATMSSTHISESDASVRAGRGKIGGLSSTTISLIVGPGRSNPPNALHARCTSVAIPAQSC